MRLARQQIFQLRPERHAVGGGWINEHLKTRRPAGFVNHIADIVGDEDSAAIRVAFLQGFQKPTDGGTATFIKVEGIWGHFIYTGKCGFELWNQHGGGGFAADMG